MGTCVSCICSAAHLSQCLLVMQQLPVWIPRNPFLIFQPGTATQCNYSVSLPTLFQVKKQWLWQKGDGSLNFTGKNKCLSTHPNLSSRKVQRWNIHYLCFPDRDRLYVESPWATAVVVLKQETETNWIYVSLQAKRPSLYQISKPRCIHYDAVGLMAADSCKFNCYWWEHGIFSIG